MQNLLQYTENASGAKTQKEDEENDSRQHLVLCRKEKSLETKRDFDKSLFELSDTSRDSKLLFNFIPNLKSFLTINCQNLDLFIPK